MEYHSNSFYFKLECLECSFSFFNKIMCSINDQRGERFLSYFDEKLNLFYVEGQVIQIQSLISKLFFNTSRKILIASNAQTC